MIKKKDLISLLSQRANVPKIYVKPIVDVFGQVLTELLSTGEGIILTDLGRFYVVDKKVHNGYDPTRNKPIVIPAHKSATFKPCKMLKEALNPLDNE